MEINLDEPTRPQLPAVFGVSSRWIGELRSKSDLPPDGASLMENIEAWAQAKYGIEGAQDALDLDAESARLKKEQADSKAMDNAERRLELASLPDMSGAVIGVIALAVGRLQQVGTIVAKGDHKLRARIDVAINDALEELTFLNIRPSFLIVGPAKKVEAVIPLSDAMDCGKKANPINHPLGAPTMNSTIPHVRVVIGFCLLAALGYLGFSIWVFGWTGDAALRGDVVGTWKSFAVASFAF